MKTHIINVPFDKLPNLQRKFYKLWAEKARISTGELMGHILTETTVQLGVPLSLEIEEQTELNRVMNLRPNPDDIKLTWSEKVSDWFKKKHFALIRFWRARTRK